MSTIYEYATKGWPVVLGCSPAMKCALRCWAPKTVNRLAHSPHAQVREAHEGLVKPHETGLRWTGTVRLNESHLADPLRWREQQIVATGYHGDLFRLPDEQIDRAFGVMALCPQHQFLTLTKQPERMRKYFEGVAEDPGELVMRWGAAAGDMLDGPWIWNQGKPFRRRIERFISAAHGFEEDCETQVSDKHAVQCPLPNLWLGVSIMDQADADAMIPLLLQTPAAHRWLSIEPMVGPVDLFRAAEGFTICGTDTDSPHPLRGLDWVVLGTESGPGARDMDLDLARKVRDDCRAAGVAFYMKQICRGGRPISFEDFPLDLQVRELPEAA